MPKEDFCFTYYDGDAARDKAHMSRLERGAYDDLISAQRKRGHLSINDIKKVLSKDFETCWSSMEWVLLKDDAGKYFIEWVDKSLEKMRRQSKIQKEKIDKYWNKKKNNTTDIPQNNNGISSEEPLVNENEDGDVFENENENENFGKSENLLIPKMLKTFKKFNASYPTDIHRDYKPLHSIAKFICAGQKIPYNPRDNTCTGQVFAVWGKISEFISKDDFFKTYNLILIEKHIQSIAQKIIHGKNKRNGSEVSTSSAFSKIDSMPDKT